MTRNNFLTAYKAAFGLLGLSALVTEVATLVGRGTFKAVNFFSFFTVENNLLVALVLLLSAFYLSAGKVPSWVDRLRGAATMYILVVGIGFAALLSGLENAVLTAVPWDNIVLHYIIPVAALGDLLIDRPRTKLRVKESLVWLLYPLAYLVYSLIRGNVTGWYPYPFLNPATKGYAGVAVTCVGILALTLALTWFVCRFSGKAQLPKRRQA